MIRFLVGIVVLALSLINSDVARASDYALTILVVDADTQAPLRFARVVVVGNYTVAGYTRADGTVNFADLDTGQYVAHVYLSGFVTADVASFSIQSNGSADIVVRLASLHKPRVIGSTSVSSASRTPSDGSTVAQQSVAVRLRGSLIDAIGDQPFANATNGNISIDGAPAQQGAVFVDGFHLAGFSAVGLRGLDSDLFDSVSISRSATTGALAGAANFRSLEPTINFQALSRLYYDSGNSEKLSASARGTVGSLGIVTTLASSVQLGSLDGQRFLDESGLAYQHSDQTSSGGSLIKLRLPVSEAASLNGLLIDSSNNADVTCRSISGPIPCGSGPGNNTSSDTRVRALSYTMSPGDVVAMVSASIVSNHTGIDEMHRILLGSPAPQGAQADILGKNISATFNAPLGSNNTISIEGTTNSFSLNVAGSAGLTGSTSSESHFQQYFFRDTNDAIRGLKLIADLGLQAANGLRSPSAHLQANIKRSQNEFQGQLGFDLGAPPPSLFQPELDPLTFTYFCSEASAVGAQNSGVANASSDRNARLNFTHAFDNGSIAFSAYDQLEHNASLLAYESLPTLGLPNESAFFNSIASTFSSPLVCGRATSIAPQNIFVGQFVDGLTVSRRALSAVGSFGIGPLVVAPYVIFQRAMVVPTISRPLLASSTLVPGQQLADVPPIRAGATIDLKPTRSPIEFLGLANVVSSNNQRRLPAYVDLSFGAAIKTARGTIIGSLSNALDTHANAFDTSSDAAFLKTSGGSFVPANGLELKPRTFSVSWMGSFGAKSSPRLISAAGAEDEDGGYSYIPEALPLSPPPEPLTIDRSLTSCRPETVRRAEKIASAIQSMVSAITATRRTTSETNTSSPHLPVIDGVEARYAQQPNGYALVLVFNRSAARAITGCLHIHGTDIAEARPRGLYADSTLIAERTFVFAPEVGLYYIAPDSDQPVESIIFDSPPASPPLSPFELRPSCPVRYRPIVDHVIEATKSSLQERKSVEDETLSIAMHGENAWYGIHIRDGLAAIAALQCLHVARASRANLDALHISGNQQPDISFSPKLGFYVLY